MSQLFASGGQSTGASTSVSNEYSNEYSRLISFRIDRLDLHPVQGTLKSLLQHHSSKASIQHSACFIVRLSYLYMTTEKTTALTIGIFVSKVMSLLFNMMSTFVIAFLPRSKHPLISWLQLLSTVILEPKKIKVCHCFHFYPIYLPWSDGTGCHDLKFSECWVLSQLSHSPLWPSSRGSLVPLHFLP